VEAGPEGAPPPVGHSENRRLTDRRAGPGVSSTAGEPGTAGGSRRWGVLQEAGSVSTRSTGISSVTVTAEGSRSSGVGITLPGS
jgi:hypothetical protein